jgi:hypothetical protein
MNLEKVKKDDVIVMKDGTEHKVINSAILYNPLNLEPVNAIFIDCDGESRKVSNDDIVEVKYRGFSKVDEVVEDKRLRKELDEKLQEVRNLPQSGERDICIVKLQEAVMWLGMDLKRLNEENPYPSSKDPSTGSKIEPTADGLKL